jgi:hypothetical protein
VIAALKSTLSVLAPVLVALFATLALAALTEACYPHIWTTLPRTRWEHEGER